MELSGVIREYIKANGEKCEIIPAPFAAPVIIPFDQEIAVGIYSGLSINVSGLLSEGQ